MEIQRIRLIRFTGQWKIPFLKVTIDAVSKCFSFKYSRNKVAAAIICLMVFCAFILSLFCSISSSVVETNLFFFSIVLRQSVTHRCRRQINVQLRNDEDGKSQRVSGWCLILSSDHYVFSLRTSKKVRQTQFVEKTQLLFQVSIDQQHRTHMF